MSKEQGSESAVSRSQFIKEEEVAEEKEVPKKLSRKEFVKGAAVGGAGVAAVSVLASCAPAATPAPEAAPTCPPAEECPPCPTPAAAGEAGPVTVDLYNPIGSTETTKLFSGRLDTLEGKTICEISNDRWESFRIFPLMRELLQGTYATATFVPYSEMPADTDHEGIRKAVAEMGCDAVILGSAG